VVDVVFVLRILVMALASPIHGEDYYIPLFSEIHGYTSSFENVVMYDKPITSQLTLDAGKYDLIVFVHLTGGTSSLAYALAKDLDKPIVLIAFDKHNALASALSARAKLLDMGVKTLLIRAGDIEDFKNSFKLLYNSVLTGYRLRNMRILEVSENGELSPQAIKYMEKIGGFIESVGFSELVSVAEKLSVSEYEEAKKEVLKYVSLSDLPQEHVDKVIRIYGALKHIVDSGGYEAVSIDCFPLILIYKTTPCLAVAMLNARGISTACELDYYSLPLLYISTLLTGKPGWIANVSGISRSGYLRFAHCTIAPSLGSSCFLTQHFETGNPYAFVCKYLYEEVLLTRLDLSYSLLKIQRGRVVDSGLLENGYCRNQLLIDISPHKPEEFIENALGNHHVIIPFVDGLINMLRYLAWWMKWSIEVRD